MKNILSSALSLAAMTATLTVAAITPCVKASAQTESKTVIVVSDWHLSDARSFNPNKYYAWTDNNQACITQFLLQLSSSKDSWDELVLNGDIFDFWRTPADVLMVADDKGNAISNIEYLANIKAQNKSIFDALEALKNAGKKIVYLPGNHDLSVSKNDIEGAFGSLFTTSYDTEATGLYEPFGAETAVAIEHGNRYEYFNAPYQHGVFGTEKVDNNCLLPPGFFTAKLGDANNSTKTNTSTTPTNAKALNIDADDMGSLVNTSSDNDYTNKLYIISGWNMISSNITNKDLNMRVNLGSDFGEWAKWSDIAVSETNTPTLFKDSWTVANWIKRCELNNVPVYVGFMNSLISAAVHEPYTTDIAFAERLTNTALPTLICVFGHTHEKQLTTRSSSTKGDVIYLNEGAWTDNTSACTYGKIAYDASKHQYSVQLHKFDKDGTDTTIDSKCLYVPENNATKQADGTWVFNSKAAIVTEDESTGISNASNSSTSIAIKRIVDGKLSITKDGKLYDASGKQITNAK